MADSPQASPASARPLEGQKLLLCVGGGIAAYKSLELVRRLRDAGAQVQVAMTAGAQQFVTPLSFQALSGQPTRTTLWDSAAEQAMGHIELARWADRIVVAPATADLLARAAHGLADDLLTSTLLTARCPVLMAPAMHTEMWESPATRDNVALLRSRGVLVLDPGVGRLTGADSGPGRLPEPEEIAAVARALLARGRAAGLDLAGRHVVVSAGGTREPLDPVRYLGNRSSGKQCYALAAAAVDRGAEVVLVSANVSLPTPEGVRLVEVETALELPDAMRAAVEGADAVVMAAAVADFRPADYQDH